MDIETIHGEVELLVFREFVEHSKIAVVPGTIEKRPLAEPDIRCVIEGQGPVAFELAGYEPNLEVHSLQAFLNVVDRDEYCCFFG